jgi:uncharacterized C2H2 Zn-finger protein
MAQEVQVMTWCDVHLQQHGDKIGATFSEVVTIGTNTAKVDLCEDCTNEFASPMLAIVSNYGTPVDGKAKAAIPTESRRSHAGGRPKRFELTATCPICHNDYKNRSSVSVHIQKAHGVTLAVAEGGGDHVKLRCPGCISVMRSVPALKEHVQTVHAELWDGGFDTDAYVDSLPDRGGLLDTPSNGVESPHAAQQELVGAES